MIAHRLATTALCAAIAASSCAGATHSPAHIPFLSEEFPKDTVRLSASELYGYWWRMIEDCANRRVSMRYVRFYAVKGRERQGSFMDPNSGLPVWGLAYDRNNAIVLALAKVTDSSIVLHEMLHLVASRKSHNPDYFQRGRCARLVACWDNCLTDTLPER